MIREYSEADLPLIIMIINLHIKTKKRREGNSKWDSLSLRYAE